MKKVWNNRDSVWFYCRCKGKNHWYIFIIQENFSRTQKVKKTNFLEIKDSRLSQHSHNNVYHSSDEKFYTLSPHRVFNPEWEAPSVKFRACLKFWIALKSHFKYDISWNFFPPTAIRSPSAAPRRGYFKGLK